MTPRNNGYIILNQDRHIGLIVIFIWLFLISICKTFGDTPLPAKFIHAIHQVETQGRLGKIRGAHGEIGPLQIREVYWVDSGVPGDFVNCYDYDYSVKVVTAYLNLYGEKHIKNNNFEILAKLHNGGPKWSKYRRTEAYWQKVRKFL